MKPTNLENTATSSIPAPPVPPPLSSSKVTWKKFQLQQAENAAWKAGVPKDISEEELCEANARINAVNSAKIKLNEMKIMEELKQQELEKIKGEREDAKNKINEITQEITDLKASFDIQVESSGKLFGRLKNKLAPKIRKNQMEIFHNLVAKTSELDAKTKNLDRCNNHYYLLTTELQLIKEKIFINENELAEAEKKIMRLDDVKAILFKAIQGSKQENNPENETSVTSNNQPNKSNDEERVNFEKFLSVYTEIKGIRNKIEELKKRSGGYDVSELNELKKKLEDKEESYQLALRLGVTAMDYQLRQRLMQRKTSNSNFFKPTNVNPSELENVNPSELEAADSKDSMKKLSS